jgi:hypothetical protein
MDFSRWEYPTCATRQTESVQRHQRGLAAAEPIMPDTDKPRDDPSAPLSKMPREPGRSTFSCNPMEDMWCEGLADGNTSLTPTAPILPRFGVAKALMRRS